MCSDVIKYEGCGWLFLLHKTLIMKKLVKIMLAFPTIVLRIGIRF